MVQKKLQRSILCSKFTKIHLRASITLRDYYIVPRPPSFPQRGKKGDGGKGRKERKGGEEKGQGGSPNFQDVVAPMMKTAFF
jgi:hypothetical protein